MLMKNEFYKKLAPVLPEKTIRVTNNITLFALKFTLANINLKINNVQTVGIISRTISLKGPIKILDTVD